MPLPSKDPTPTGPEPSREALLSVGTEIFAEVGFDGARVGAIAERAGVNAALINYYFGGKAGLYRAILGETLTAVADELKPLRSSGRPADERLQELIGSFAAIATRRPAFPTMVLREALSGGVHLEGDLFDRFLEVFRTVQEILEQGVREGAFRPVDPLLTHLGLVGGLVFFFATRTFRERLMQQSAAPLQPPAAEEFIRHLQELMDRGLAPDTASRQRPAAEELP